MTATQRGILSRRLERLVIKENKSKEAIIDELILQAKANGNDVYLNILCEYKEGL